MINSHISNSCYKIFSRRSQLQTKYSLLIQVLFKKKTQHYTIYVVQETENL